MTQTLNDLNYLPIQTTMPLMNPQYPPQYYQKFTLLKKHIQLQVWTLQANNLAQQLIPFGQTNYNCWYVKKMCYLAGVVTCQHELQFSEQTLYEKIKNFQLWEHRRFLIQRNNQLLPGEFALVDRVLEIEPKNYHAWSHRTWIVEQMKNFIEEIQLTRKMLLKDPYNNSVWAYRSYLVKKIVQAETNHNKREKVVELEITQCLTWLTKHLNNQAAWNYLRGYLPSIKLKAIPCTNTHTPIPPVPQTTLDAILSFLKTNVQQIENIFKQQNFAPKHYYYQTEIQLLITLAFLYSQNSDTAEYARNTCAVLAEKDAQKRFYWKWVATNI